MTEVVLVTGGASGIGAAVARRFAKAGAHVVIADVDPAGETVAAEVGGLFAPTDVSSERDNDNAVAAAREAFGQLDIVHLNAGIGGGGTDFDLDRYRRIMAVNVDGTMFGIRAAVRGGPGRSWSPPAWPASRRPRSTRSTRPASTRSSAWCGRRACRT